jgi:hypothetical protein
MGEAGMVTVIRSNRDVVLGTQDQDKDFTLARVGSFNPVAGPDNRRADYAPLTARHRSAMSSAQCRMISLAGASRTANGRNSRQMLPPRFPEG